MKSPISIKRLEPPLGPNPDYSRAIYPNAPSHDFCVWLIIAELMRRYHDAPGPLKVRLAFIKSQLGTVDFGDYSIASGFNHPVGVQREYANRMLLNVVRPAIEMIGAVEERELHAPWRSDEIANYVEYDYHIGHLVDAGREGHIIPKWSPPQWAHDEVRDFLGGRKPIIITLRETEDLQPERNSRIEEWLRVGMLLESDGYFVLFVRDTCKAHQNLPFPTWQRASCNAYVRAALYQRALVNMMVCNGPNTWCIFSDAPYLIFKELVPELPDWEHGQPKGWKEQDHMDVGEQYAWASPLQRLTWKDDTFDNIIAEFKSFLSDVKNA